MNIHFQPVGKRSQIFSYILVASAVFMISMLTLSFSRHAELHLFIPSISMQAIHSDNTNVPVAIPAPLPPAEHAHAMVTPEPFANSQAALMTQAVASRCHLCHNR
jgi:hypothetical protein